LKSRKSDFDYAAVSEAAQIGTLIGRWPQGVDIHTFQPVPSRISHPE
jgi:hypothetical protein